LDYDLSPPMEGEVRRVLDAIPELIWTADPSGNADFLNRQWCEYTGLPLTETLGFGWQRAIWPEDLPKVTEYWRSISVLGGPREIEARIRRRDGLYRWFLFRCSPLREALGKVTQCYVTSSDIDDRKRLEDALRASEESFRLIVDSIPGLVFTATPDGEVEFVNRQLQEYFGRSFDELKRWSTIDVVHPDDLPTVVAKWKHSVEAGTPHTLDHRLRRADGVYRWFQIRAMPRRNGDGRIIRWYAVLTDIEELKTTEQKLRRSEASLLEAQRLGHSGSWGLNIATGVISTTPEMLRAYQAKAGEDVDHPDFWFGRIHPDDRKRVRETFEDCVATKTNYESKYRLLLPDGTIRYQRAIGRPVLNESGELVEFVGTAIDMTEQQEAFNEIKRLKDRLHEENQALREQLDREFMFDEIVGSSQALQTVLTNIVKVAPTDSTVLISGETGTGKELIARAIHKRSQRAAHAFIAVHCAAVPSTLIASELFGHEKGAFTGALQRRQGRFELASGGTIFLDEIGELPPETQLALLRVLQERQFERVGSARPIPVDVRVIAATNRDLRSAIAAGEFRADLFYRLNVFPIEVPPLRERKSDIPLLIGYFVQRYADKAGKRITKIDKKTLALCQSYDWPGNIRELQNIVERSVILATGDTFWIDEAWLSSRETPHPAGGLSETLEVREKEIIEAALAESRGRVAGPNGAAAKLGIPRSTLDWKIRQLRINRHRFDS
jgi:formate hydrogenlyase transcriptional activator